MVAIDSYAGPSEVAVVADATVAPVLVAADMLAQAEHGPGGSAAVITWDEEFATRSKTSCDTLLGQAAREAERWLRAGGRVVLVDGPEQAMAAANAIAPEHLEADVRRSRRSRAARSQRGRGVRRRRRVGGDRRLRRGVNHVLPTGGTARYTDALRVDDFRKHVHVVSLEAGALAGLAPFVDDAGRRRRTLGPRRRDPPAGETVTPARDARIQPRDDLRSLDGYHSPQVDVRIRLNTNESPYAPPDEFVDALHRRAARRRVAPLSRSRRARARARRWVRSLGPTD